MSEEEIPYAVMQFKPDRFDKGLALASTLVGIGTAFYTYLMLTVGKRSTLNNVNQILDEQAKSEIRAGLIAEQN